MKNAVNFTAMFAVFLGVLSCQKEELDSESGLSVFTPLTITAVTESIGNIKSQVAYTYDLLWEVDDEICVGQYNGSSTDKLSDNWTWDTFKLTSGYGTKVGKFTQQGKEEFANVVSAFYPKSLVDKVPVWPSVQTADQKVPLFCEKALTGTEGETFNFSSLGAILQIVFNTTVKDVTLASIEVWDHEKTMSGKFYVDENGKAVIKKPKDKGSKDGSITLDLGSGVVLGKGANYFNIAVPAGNYQNFTLIFTDTKGFKCIMTGGKANLEKGEIGKLTLTGTKFQDCALPGKFSVGENKKVRFSKGNLYWNGSVFKMEAQQYDCPKSWDANHIAHFYWSPWNTDAQTTATTTRTSINGEFFTNESSTTPNPKFIASSLEGVYRILSENEWNYLLNSRENASKLYKTGVTVCGVSNCLVIAPDNWYETGATEAQELDKNFSFDSWNFGQNNGLVCLPPTGERDNSNTSLISEAGNSGIYWTSSFETTQPGHGNVKYISFSATDPDSNLPGLSFNSYGWDGNANYSGYSVRLVVDVKN